MGRAVGAIGATTADRRASGADGRGWHRGLTCPAAQRVASDTRPRAAEIMVDGTSVKLVRKRETMKDLLRQEV